LIGEGGAGDGFSSEVRPEGGYSDIKAER
jgi:hypothetical protein